MALMSMTPRARGSGDSHVGIQPGDRDVDETSPRFAMSLVAPRSGSSKGRGQHRRRVPLRARPVQSPRAPPRCSPERPRTFAIRMHSEPCHPSGAPGGAQQPDSEAVPHAPGARRPHPQRRREPRGRDRGPHRVRRTLPHRSAREAQKAVHSGRLTGRNAGHPRHRRSPEGGPPSRGWLTTMDCLPTRANGRAGRMDSRGRDHAGGGAVGRTAD